jgi:hypothetical protein
MASPQFLAILKQLYETGEQKPLRWEPVKRSRHSAYCDIYLALGQGIIHLSSNEADEESLAAKYVATLLTREGLIVEELTTSQLATGYSSLVRDLFRQARAAAFNLPQMIESMQQDLAVGTSREIPPVVLSREREDDFVIDEDLDIPF